MSNKKLSSFQKFAFSALEDSAPYIQNYDMLKEKIIKYLEKTGDISSFNNLFLEDIKSENVMIKGDLKIYLNYLSKYLAERR